MEFFRSAKLRRIVYAVAFALALVRFAVRSQPEEQPIYLAAPPAPAAIASTHHAF